MSHLENDIMILFTEHEGRLPFSYSEIRKLRQARFPHAPPVVDIDIHLCLKGLRESGRIRTAGVPGKAVLVLQEPDR